MDNNKHLLYYWKSFGDDLKEGRVGWLGTSNPGKRLFVEFNRLLKPSVNSYLIAFRWEKATKKTFPLAILKAIEQPAVRVNPRKEYAAFIYYDPRQSYRLNQPTDSSRLQKFHELGEKIREFYGDNAASANYVGANGIKPISTQDMEALLKDSKTFQGEELSLKVNNDSWLIEPTSTATNSSKPYSDDDELEKASTQIDALYANKPGEDVDAIVKRRIGQGPFRNLLAKKYGVSCFVSGLTNERLLIASHIVPWSKASPTQKTDPENGLLLSVSWDALFDKGFVSFSDDGKLLCAEKLEEDTARQLGISMTAELPVDMLTEARKKNLRWHRKNHGFKA